MVRIITDSTSDMREDVRERVLICPLTVCFGDEEFVDGVEIDKNAFYDRLVNGDILPKTSQAGPETFEKAYKKVTEEGDEALVICLSSKLSGTFQSACIAAEDYPNVRVVDSLNVAMGGGILVEYALKCAEAGMGLDELAAEIEKKKGDIVLVAVVDTLEFLYKGGRLSRMAAVAGGILNVKPVIAIEEGEVHVLGKARGLKKAKNFLTDKVEARPVDWEMPILLGYSGTSDENVKTYMEDARALWEGHGDKLEYVQLCSVIGVHAGPGAIAVCYFEKK